MAEKKPLLTRQLSLKDIVTFLKWALVIALILCSPVSLFLCWQLQRQLDQARDEQRQAKLELASINRVEVVEQSGVFKLEAIRGVGEPVCFPRPYDAPPALTIEPLFRPFANVGGETDELKLKRFQEMQDDRTRESFQRAMKAFELVGVYADRFCWEIHIDRTGGSYPVVAVKWKARGLIGSKKPPAE